MVGDIFALLVGAAGPVLQTAIPAAVALIVFILIIADIRSLWD